MGSAYEANLDRQRRMVLSAKVTEENNVHTRIAVWNRGGYSGELVVNTSDAKAILGALKIEVAEE